MSGDLVVEMSRRTLEAAIWVSAPILAVAVVVSLVVSLVQVLTSLQEATLSTVPRLAAVGAACFSFCHGWCAGWECSRCQCFPTSNISCVEDFREWAFLISSRWLPR
jgi:flagellar biosynthetic protein FliQ